MIAALCLYPLLVAAAVTAAARAAIRLLTPQPEEGDHVR